jgi:hypothetical protein
MGWLGLRRTPATPQLASGALGVNSTHFSECALMSLKVQFDFDSTIWLENAGRLKESAQPYPRTRTGYGCNVAF